jgi:hypothetical protein
MSKKQMPPIPPEQVSDKGPNAGKRPETGGPDIDKQDRNLAEQGRQGDIKQNTTNQGHQQNR